jgi:hypothetical protein
MDREQPAGIQAAAAEGLLGCVEEVRDERWAERICDGRPTINHMLSHSSKICCELKRILRTESSRRQHEEKLRMAWFSYFHDLCI